VVRVSLRLEGLSGESIINFREWSQLHVSMSVRQFGVVGEPEVQHFCVVLMGYIVYSGPWRPVLTVLEA
jgi:hypothetical protein